MLGKKNAVMLENSAHPARKASWLCLLVGSGLCALVLSPAVHAQKTEKFSRKLVYRENPGYPLTLREAHIGGVVRLEIVISAKGTVDQVSPLGGNPVLVEAASNAVKKWKYAPADSESKTEVEFTFDPRR
jgi:TonB family protein